MAQTYDKNGKWSKTTTFTTPSGWHISTSLSHTKGETDVKKSQDFTKLDELPEEIQQGIMDGTLSIKLK
tara:strand:- start:27 stop:233 length:207 start_codon:yes stop_codon:yes gene_type:complete